MMTLEKLAEIITEKFGPPFLPEGHVIAKVTDKGTLFLKIGPRDIDLAEDGEVLGSGTMVAPEQGEVAQDA